MRKEKAGIKSSQILGLTGILVLTWGIDIYHVGVFPVPELLPEGPHSSQWVSKEGKYGINQLILKGGDYRRGLDEGHYTSDLLYLQETELITRLKEMFPNPAFRRVLEVLTIRWFWGIEKYFEPWMTREMYGISKSASHDFDYLANGFTRQIAYHGLHEVGQMMVDQGGEGMGCTVVAIPQNHSWVLGRNFDFEAGRIFDSEKIMKWVFPNEGYPYVSITWAGMVGAVTGVNERGVYISLNAAGSRDMRRYGTPSTLVLLKALQFSQSAEEAVERIRQGTLFITDIFVVADRHSNKLYRIEKSPKHTEVLISEGPTIVTNHLESPRWKDDSINLYRRNELTSDVRVKRGEHLLAALDLKEMRSSQWAEHEVLKILRDKGEFEGHSLHLGNRNAIDAQIATHSVIYNAVEKRLYVSQGPGVSGPFRGFDLEASFKTGEPVQVSSLPRDPLVSDQTFEEIHQLAKRVSQAESLIKKNQCELAHRTLEPLSLPSLIQSYSYYAVLGDDLFCLGDHTGAKAAWQKALALKPAYPHQVRALKRKLKQ